MSERDFCYGFRRGGVVLNVIVGLCVVLVVWVVVFPMLASGGHHGDRPWSTTCQSNMNQIGKSIKTYLSDWDETYPTNRTTANAYGVYPSTEVPLGKPGINADTGKPFKSTAGVCWVEGMHPYMEPITEQDDPQSVWKCRAVVEGRYEPASRSAAVSYVMNRNLIEKSVDQIHYPATLMLLRETDRLVDSALRPVNDSCTENQPPVSAFLTGRDRRLGFTSPELHGTGSHVLFADGHFKVFARSAFSDKCKWDPQTETWKSADGSVTVSP